MGNVAFLEQRPQRDEEVQVNAADRHWHSSGAFYVIFTLVLHLRTAVRPTHRRRIPLRGY
jgi:hypothetical protein